MKSLDALPFEVEAVSVGGLETCIQLPEFKTVLDMGRCPPRALRFGTVLLTHGHMDHAGGVPFHAATRHLRGQTPPTYVCPPYLAPRLELVLESFRAMDGSALPCEVVSLEPGQEVALGNNCWGRPFRTYHRQPSQGYGIWRRSRKLKPEFQGRSSQELATLRAEGVEIVAEAERLEVAFTGDTLIDFVEREPEVRRARLLIMEVTFLCDSVSVEHARKTGHVHLDEVAERAELFENEALLLTHFSARYGAQQIQDWLEAKLPDALKERCVPLLPDAAWC